jgi:RNA-binding protein 23/39
LPSVGNTLAPRY